MKKEDKGIIIEQLQTVLGEYSHFYLTNIEGLNAEQTSNLRRQCFKN
ncbi:MAG: 50S ribosomal protein L10, partial [Paludibacteraceae bacterium]|nr:50S ribosomal protein L10 [Paludibacteraceae bacterium]